MRFTNWTAFLLILGLAWLGIGCGEEENLDLESPTAAPMAYIVNQLAQTITTFNLDTKEIQADVYTVGNAPNDVKIQGNLLYVVNTMDNNLQIIDLDTGNSDLIDLGPGSSPEKMAFVDETKVYVTAGTANSVKVVDLSSKSVVKEIPVGTSPWGIAVTGGKAYVVNSAFDFTDFTYHPGSVSIIDTTTDEVIQTIDVGVNPQEIALDGRGRVIVVCTGNYADITGNLTIIDPATATPAEPIDLGTIPSGITVRKDGVAFLTFSNFATGESGLLSFDTNSDTWLHSISDPLLPGSGGLGLAADQQGQVYVAVPDWDGSGRDKLLILDANDQLVGTYELSNGGAAASFIAIRE